MDGLKKIIAVFVSAILAIYGFLGLSSNISDDYAEGKYKNVILFIGDGMGDNTIEATKAQRGVELAMETMPVRGHSDIDSFMVPATDSAAGGTALAVGIRVWFNSVAVFPFDPFTIDDMNVPITLCELAKYNGKASGVVTTDATSGATPSDFTAHVLNRDMEEDICADQLVSGLDLIWGGKTDSINKENTAANGFTYIDNRDDMMALEAGSRSFAQFSRDDLKNCTDKNNTPSIAEMTTKAIELLNADEDGFFLMVEGACIDKFSHSNEFDGCTKSTVEFDKAVAAALEFAEEDGETLIVVTADHETGGIKYNEKKNEYYYTSGTHSLIDVPYFVSAEDAGFEDGGNVKNREIAVQIARVLGYSEEQFPAARPW